MKTKNTRLVYTDDKNLKIYQSLPDKDFKEFFMTYLTYEIGDDVSKTISNPYLQTMFMAAYADKIKYNEEKWERKAKANRENGKKGGRPPKNNTDLQPNTEFDTEAKISPNEPCLAINGTDVPQEAESVPEGPKQAEFDNSIEVFEKAYSDKLINFIDTYSLKIEFIIETLSKYNINPNSVDYRTLETEKDRMRKMINYLGGNTKDARDLEDFFNKRIDEAIAKIVLNEVRR